MKNQYGKVLEYQIIENQSNILSMKPANLIFTRDVSDVLGHKDIETTENYYISSTDETRRNVTDSYENAINLDVIEDIIKYEIG